MSIKHVREIPIWSRSPPARVRSKLSLGGVIIDALDVLCAQLTRDLFAIAKFLY